MNSLCSGSEVGQRLDGVPSEHWRFSEGDLWQSWLKEFNSRARLIDSRIMNSIDAVSCAEGLGRLVRAGTIVSCSHVLDIDRRAGAAGKSALSALLADQLRKSESCKRLEYRTLTFAQGVGFHGTLWIFYFTNSALAEYRATPNSRRLGELLRRDIKRSDLSLIRQLP